MSSSFISSSKPAKARFFWKLSLLLGPLAIWLGFPVLVLVLSGELFGSIDALVEAHANPDNGAVIGLAYSNPVHVLKLRAAKQRQARVLAVGTSRVMQFRSGFFEPAAAFYNAGGGVDMVWQLEDFTRQVTETRAPAVILLGLDQWEFNDAWEKDAFAKRVSPYQSYRDLNPLQVIQANWRAVYHGYAEGKFTCLDLVGRPQAIGLHAKAKGAGFRRDGSHAEGGELRWFGHADPTSLDHQFRDTLQRIDAGARRFEYGQTASRERIDTLVPFLDLCRQRGIHVAAFLPPFAPTVARRIETAGEKYAYMGEAKYLLSRLLASYDFTLADLTDISGLGSTDAEFLDGFHGSEKAYLRMLIALAQADPVLERYVSRPRLQQLLANAEGNCSVFGD